MRTLKRNQRQLYYALFLGAVPKKYVDSEGNEYETGESVLSYDVPVKFNGNIAMSGSGQSEEAEFGLDLSDYNATLITDKNRLPITESSLIWYESEPKTDADGHALKESADYTVVKVNRSLNFDKYVLKKTVKSNG